MPSWHPLTQTGLRFAILAALGRSSRLLGHGQPLPVRWGSGVFWCARIKGEPYQSADTGSLPARVPSPRHTARSTSLPIDRSDESIIATLTRPG